MRITTRFRRKSANLISKVRGLIHTRSAHVRIGTHVELPVPETILFKGSCEIKPHCRLESSLYNRIVIGNNVIICSYTTIETAGGDIEIGDNIVIGEYSTFQGQGGIQIKNNVLLASHIHFISNHHEYEDVYKPIKEQGDKSAKIVVEENAWIGINVVIFSGVTIGRNSVIGTGSVVKNDIPPYSVAVGNPACVVKKYDFVKKEWVRV